MPEMAGTTPKGPSHDANNTINPTPSPPPSFPLFKLPLELRQYVYDCALIQDKQLLHLAPPQRQRRQKSDLELKKTHITALLTTNHQIYHEALPSFLSKNAFVIIGISADHKWLSALGSHGQAQLRTVTFQHGSRSYSASNLRILNILSSCPALTLTIHAHCRQLGNLMNMGLLKNLHGFAWVTLNEDKTTPCPKPHHRWGGSILANREEEMESVQKLMEQSVSACPQNCRAHREKERERVRCRAGLHIECDYGCSVCYFDY